MRGPKPSQVKLSVEEPPVEAPPAESIESGETADTAVAAGDRDNQAVDMEAAISTEADTPVQETTTPADAVVVSSRAAHGEGAQKAAAEVSRIATAAVHAKSLGLIVAAGHGLTYRNVAALAAIPEITEFNIGHNIISRSVFVGLAQAVREMIAAIKD
ncbi:pyridoxine 5'-phosphate synthase [Leptolyngbya sp. 7M]|nr:pyridoxine 5'-phosphate synthase [Leptolyngbya sp. 7M]